MPTTGTQSIQIRDELGKDWVGKLGISHQALPLFNAANLHVEVVVLLVTDRAYGLSGVVMTRE